MEEKQSNRVLERLLIGTPVTPCGGSAQLRQRGHERLPFIVTTLSKRHTVRTRGKWTLLHPSGERCVQTVSKGSYYGLNGTFSEPFMAYLLIHWCC